MGQMDGPVAGSVKGRELSPPQTPARWRWGTGMAGIIKDELVGAFSG